ncbi:MAG TPA: putative sulfate/molybdate transporter [Dehalococcoidia bacterium]|nr:putative sulfate/molybdate transporter [Dehalococcoidia bacterium]
MQSVATSSTRRPLSGEISGAFADLGVLVPLEAALIAINGLNPTSTLLGVGLAYIIAGRYFGLPMPVQPLKAFAAVAIATQASPEVIAAGALLMSGSMAVIGLSGAAGFLARFTPLGVIRGIQLGLAILLLKNGVEFVLDKPFLLQGDDQSLDVLGGVPWGLPVAIASGLLLLLLLRRPAAPASLAVLAFGAGLGFLIVSPDASGLLQFGPASWSFVSPNGADFATALTLLVIPQIPLTMANSVVATSDAAEHYFGQRASRATPRRLSLSIALGNLWAGLMGGLPICHGCGGLTAHYRLGARTPLATTITGVTLVVIALAFGAAALEVRAVVPYAVYGVLLLYVGAEHLRLAANSSTVQDRSLTVITALAAFLLGGNLAYGAAAGLAAAALLACVRLGLPRLRRAFAASMAIGS